MQTKVILYIGADNQTGKITKEYENKIETILKKYWKNFTLRKGKGCYEGNVEQSIEAVVYTLNLIFEDLYKCIDELKIKLIQEKIGYVVEYHVDFKLR